MPLLGCRGVYERDLDLERPLIMRRRENERDERDRLEVQYIGERETDFRRRFREIDRLRRKLLLRRDGERRRLEGERFLDNERLLDERKPIRVEKTL